MDYSNQEKISMPTASSQPTPTNQQPANVVYMAQPQIQVGPDPTVMTCPHCNARITTNMEKAPSMKTHLFFILLCALGCCCCAPCIYCNDSCLAKKHTCPNCNQFLGVYDK